MHPSLVQFAGTHSLCCLRLVCSLCLTFCAPPLCLSQSILEYNGAAIIAMKGKDCVAIAADKRLGVQAQTVSMNFQKIFEMNDKLYIGLPGLATDVQTV